MRQRAFIYMLIFPENSKVCKRTDGRTFSSVGSILRRRHFFPLNRGSRTRAETGTILGCYTESFSLFLLKDLSSLFKIAPSSEQGASVLPDRLTTKEDRL